MRKKFSLDNISDVQFEDYCYDLLDSMGFVNLDWRKGTGKGSSSSDSGRDLECEYVVTDPDGTVHVQKWYVECKHYTRGIPATAIANALTWAGADRPDVLLVIASNHFSNPSKDHIRSYQENNKPAFRIKTWELPDLERHSKGKPLLLRKYGLETNTEILDLMHPAHLEYIKSPKLNRLNTLFNLLDQLEAKDRDDITGWLWELMLKPRRREPKNKNETMGALLLDPVDYPTFKKKCFEMAMLESMDDILLCHFIVNFLIQELFSQGDITSIDAQMERHRDTVDFIKDLSIREPERFSSVESVEDTIKRFKENFDTLPQRIVRWHALYNIFCEEVVARLLEEDIFAKAEIENP